MKKTYIQPEVDVTWLSLEAMICFSGDAEEGLPIDPPVDPWSVSASSIFDDLL